MKLAFYKANQPKADWRDKIIAWWTDGPYSHVEIISDDGYMYSTSPRDGKVRKKKHLINEITWDYVDIEVNEEVLKDFFNLTQDEPYDWFGIVGFILPFKDRTNAWFCSEWCANVLKISGDKRFWKIEPSKISPNKLYKIIKNQIITKGQ